MPGALEGGTLLTPILWRELGTERAETGAAVSLADRDEEEAEWRLDEAYWKPLREEMERLRHARGKAQ